MDKDLEFKRIYPDKSIADFVESFWLLVNHSDSDKEIVILPDGRMDLFFAASATEPFHITLSGLETRPDKATLAARTTMFAISFRLLAAEYIFQNSVAGLLDDATYLPAGFWNFSATDLQDFDGLSKKAAQQIQAMLPKEIDDRKRKLFDLIYSSNGAMTVKELSEKVFWSSRQIISGTEFHRSVPFHQGSEKACGCIAKRTEQKSKRPIYTIFHPWPKVVLYR